MLPSVAGSSPANFKGPRWYESTGEEIIKRFCLVMMERGREDARTLC